MEKKYYKRLDLIRLLSCIGVLLYHIGYVYGVDLLKGGYLAVCTFFVMTGYLSVVSSMNKDNFSIKEYYSNKIKKIYLPLLIVAFSSVAIISLLESIDWLNLKPETTSVIFGYNNFWQISAGADYFTRLISSPFMHFWYISILLQFELIFPFIFIIFKKVGKKIGKGIPSLFFLMLGLASYAYFCTLIKNGEINPAYYGTFTRAFSLLFGLSLGFFHSFYKPIVIKDKIINIIVFYFYIIATILMYFVVGTDFCSLSISMIISTIISLRLISYAAKDIKGKNKIDIIVSSFSSISYEIYLVQYPVIFILQTINMNSILKIVLTILITIILSYIIHFALNIKKSRIKILSIILSIFLLGISVFGLYKYITTEDHTKEMEKLKNDLAENQKLIEKQREEYLNKKKSEEDEWQKVLNDLSVSEEELKEKVRNMQVVGVGDSIMELAVRDLYKEFPNGYFDAATNRTEKAAKEVLKDLKNKGMLGDVVILNIGTNGSCLGACKEEVMEILGNRTVFWLNATNPDYNTFNPSLIDLASKHDNLHIIDWITVMKENPGYLISDKVHPTVKGCKLYAQTIYNALYDFYLKEYNKIKEEKIKEHEDLEKEKITFIGNELLLGLYPYLQNDFDNSEYIIDKDFTYNSLKEKIKEKIDDKSLSHNMVLVLDKKINISNNDYSELIELLKDYKLFIIDLGNSIEFNNENVIVINFNRKIKTNKEYISFDNIHLTEEGSKALKKEIDSVLKK